MLPAEGVLRAAQRWLEVLTHSSVNQAWAIIRTGANFADMSPTQYAAGLEWLETARLLETRDGHLGPSATIQGLNAKDASVLLFSRSLETAAPPWLRDADTLVPDPAEMPQDAASLAAALGVPDNAAWLAVQQIHGHIDLAQRARVGAAGERGLVAALEHRWPGCTSHAALDDDGLGYDIVLTLHGQAWHLEVKTTSRLGRLVIHLSRHQYEVGLRDPAWRLVIVGIDDLDEPTAIATVEQQTLRDRSPRDIAPGARWDSAAFQLGPEDLRPGLSFLNPLSHTPQSVLLHGGVDAASRRFAWMPVLG